MTDREKTLVSDAKTNIDNFECDDQVMELDLDDLDGAAGGKSSPQHRPFKGYGSKDVYDRMMQINNHTYVDERA